MKLRWVACALVSLTCLSACGSDDRAGEETTGGSAHDGGAEAVTLEAAPCPMLIADRWIGAGQDVSAPGAEAGSGSDSPSSVDSAHPDPNAFDAQADVTTTDSAANDRLRTIRLRTIQLRPTRRAPTRLRPTRSPRSTRPRSILRQPIPPRRMLSPATQRWTQRSRWPRRIGLRLSRPESAADRGQ